MDTIAFQETLRDFATQFKSWSEPIVKLKRSWQRKPMRGVSDIEKYHQEIAEITKEQTAKYDLPQLVGTFLDEHYQVYLGSTPSECSITRAICVSSAELHEFLLFSYIRRVVAQLQATGKQEWLLRGLVAMSLEDSSDDYRDTLKALAELFVNAENKGLAPKSSFQLVAKLSSYEQPKGGPIPMSEILMDFTNFPIVQERRKRNKSYWEEERFM